MPTIPTGVNGDWMHALQQELAGVEPMSWEELKYLRLSIEESGQTESESEITKYGDLWTLDTHRLLCGDARSLQDVNRLMEGNRATCVFTDPPYGVSIGAKNRMLNTFQRAGRCLEDIEDDDLDPDALRAMLAPAFDNVRTSIMADDCTVMVCSPQGGDLGLIMLLMMTDAKLPVRHILIWYKNQPTFSVGRLDYDYQHEPIMMTWGKKHKRPLLSGQRTTVWRVDRPSQSKLHPTMKPIELYTIAYMNHTDVGDVVADIYAGSGTAFIAAEQTNRRCFGVEIDPRYIDVILQRWADYTKKDPIREDGAKFSELKAEAKRNAR